MGISSHPKPYENAWLWFIKILGGVLIFITLGIHLVVNHLVAKGGLLNYQGIVQYYQISIVPIMEISFLFFAVVHSLLGTRSIILDLNPSKNILKGINILLILVGSTAIIYGVWLVILITGRGS
jgi:succinate dehydrogenase hydrophobic anchor subunit